jgi:hypothetical protein
MPDTRLHVDFNDTRQDGRLRGLSRYADDPSAITPGAQVELWDDEGNTAQGRVVELGDRGLVWFELISGTWRDPDDPSQSAPELVGLLGFHTDNYLYLSFVAHSLVTHAAAGSAVAVTYGSLVTWRQRGLIGRFYYEPPQVVTGVAPMAAGVGASGD